MRTKLKRYNAREGCLYTAKANKRLANAIRELKAIKKEAPLYFDSDIQQALSILISKR